MEQILLICLGYLAHWAIVRVRKEKHRVFMLPSSSFIFKSRKDLEETLKMRTL
jgi:hypothetical protein